MKYLQNYNIPVSREVAAGAAVYSKFILFFYDIWVMLFENRFVFKCSTQKIIKFYNENISNKHLDVGVGTGYFLDKCIFPSNKPLIHLMDLNPNTLEKTARRIKRYRPIIHQWNILEPITLDLPKFDSICISNVLHCLPGNIKDKETVLINLRQFLNKNGTLFGLTVLGKYVQVGLLYKIFNTIYNKLSLFTNLNDDLEGLEGILKGNFSHYKLELIGSVALFSCNL